MSYDDILKFLTFKLSRNDFVFPQVFTMKSVCVCFFLFYIQVYKQAKSWYDKNFYCSRS